MARRALECSRAVAISSAHHIEEMPMAIIALLRIVGCSMAVNTARMRHYGIKLLPSSQSFAFSFWRFFSGDLLAAALEG